MQNQTDARLLEELRGPLENLIVQDIHGDVDREKIVQYANARRNDLYYSGKQYIYPVQTNGQTVDWSATTGNLVSNADPGGRTYDYCFNLIRGDGDKAIAVLAQKAPTIKAMPDRPDDSNATQRSRKADNLAGIMRSHWRIDEQQRHLALSLYKNGTTFLYTPWVANASRYGTTEEPVYDMVPTPIGEPYFQCVGCGSSSPMDSVECPQCGRPLGPEDMREPAVEPMLKQVGSKKYANGSVELILASIFEVTTPFYIKNLSESPWLWYEYEVHRGSLMAIYPETREMFKGEQGHDGESASSSSGRFARDTAASPSKTYISNRKNRWLYSRYWLRPSMYELMVGDMGNAYRDKLYEQFPHGLKATCVQGKLIKLEPEKLDEVWTAIKPRASEYLYADPLCEDYIGPQDVYNDMYNILVESAERSIPFTLYDPRILDHEMLKKHRATPLEMVPTLPGFGSDLRSAMFTPQTAEVQPEVARVMEGVKAGGRELIGVLPAMFGGDDGRDQTAREAEMKRNQALMQLNTTWNYIRNGIAAACENAAVQYAKHSGGKVFVHRGASLPPEEIEFEGLDELALGGWHYEAEEAMPMTWGQRSDKFWGLLEKPPEVWQLTGLIDQEGTPEPENILTLQEIIGMPDWKVPKLDDLYKVQETIRRLSTQDPILGPMGELMPSIPADEFEDDHMFCAKVIQKWAQTQKARDLRDSDPGKYGNVIAWGKQHFIMAQPPPMPVGDGGGGQPSDAPPMAGGDTLQEIPPTGPPPGPGMEPPQLIQ